MTSRATSYITGVAASGTLALAGAAYQFHMADPGLCGMLAMLAAIGVGLKVRVPGVDGNVSLSFVPLILSAVLLSAPEAIVIAAGSALLQATVFARKFRPLQAVFNCAALVLSVAAAALAAGAALGRAVDVAHLALAGVVYYVCNSALVTFVIGLAENRAVGKIWNDCAQLYLPYFAAGLAWAVLAITGAPPSDQKVLRYPGLVLLPALLLFRQYFKTMAERRTA